MSTAAATMPNAAPFGTVFSPHMSVAWFRAGSWEKPQMRTSDSLPLHPAAHALHYGSSCFEGLKAFRHADGTLHLFRVDRHIARMRASAQLLCMPVPDPINLQMMICGSVDTAREEAPPIPGALYIRPTLIGTEPNIGAAGAGPAEACLYVLVSPVGDYFTGGLRPLRILVEDEHPRSTNEFGMAKTGANYASGLRHIVHARTEHQADQVLFCPRGDVQETGASNFFLIDDDELLTKPLDSSYLHGVTRDSLLTIAAGMGYRVVERDFTVAEMLERAPRCEAALSGTAAVLAPVGTLIHAGVEHRVGDGAVGPHTRRLREALTRIQHGEANDDHGWLVEV